MCKGVELSKMNDVNLLRSFQRLIGSNVSKLNSESFRDLCPNGLRVNQEVADANTDAYRLYSHESGFPVGTTDSNANNGYINLNEILPILKVIQILDTSVLKDVRIRIEFETNAKNLVSVRNVDATTTRPKLVFNCLYDEMVINQLKSRSGYGSDKGVMWNEFENDSFNILDSAAPPNGSLLDIPTNVRLNGFSNKFVNRMVLIKTYENPQTTGLLSEPTANSNGLNGNLNSVLTLNERVQITVNGSNLFNGVGLSNAGAINREFVETWGDIPSGLGESVLRTSFTSIYYKATQFLAQHDGNKSYIGFGVYQNVRDLQIRHTRSVNQNTGDFFNQPLRVIVVGEVMKRVVLNGKDGKPVIYYS